jgi:hypothetical protein
MKEKTTDEVQIDRILELGKENPKLDTIAILSAYGSCRGSSHRNLEQHKREVERGGLVMLAGFIGILILGIFLVF